MSGERLQDHWSSGILFKCHHNPGLALTNFMARSNFVTFNYIYIGFKWENVTVMDSLAVTWNLVYI